MFGLTFRATVSAQSVVEDAFGPAIGIQSVGLYSPTDARGFSPQQAGNLRIEGLYFDQQTGATAPCLARETTINIGLAAQPYDLPSPTGIVDIHLRTPNDQSAFTGFMSLGPFNGLVLQLDQQLPLISKVLDVDICMGYFRNVNVDLAKRDQSTEYGVNVRWHPTSSFEVIPFGSYLTGTDREVLPSVYTDGTASLPFFRQSNLGSQRWTNQGWRMMNVGTLVKTSFDTGWNMAAALFRSQEHDPANWVPYVVLQATGIISSALDFAPPLQADSTSGEVRAIRELQSGTHSHRLELSIRGRSVIRSFGGDDNINLGNIASLNIEQTVQPATLLTPQSHDLTRQLDVGATYEERWKGWGSMGIGLLHSHYARTVELPDLGASTSRANPNLFNFRFTIDRGDHLIYYGSFIQGLEDSAQAPVSAINRGEPPIAARTRQVDSGIRYAPNDSSRYIFGVFDIHKPYLNVDDTGVYRAIGQLRSSGIETSVSYAHHDFTVLAGAVLLRSRINNSILPGTLSSLEPLGAIPLTLLATTNYAPPKWGPWSVSLQWNWLSRRNVSTDNTLRLPALSTAGVGVLCRWKTGSQNWLARLDGFNLADAQGLHVSSLSLVVPEQRRRFSLTFSTDR